MALESLPRASSTRTSTITTLLTVLLVCTSLLAAACGNSASQSSKKVLWIGASVGGDYTKAFSPYDPTVNQGTTGIKGLVYETLLFFNRNNGQITPWLASGYQFSSDGTQLTFTIRQNVKWSDGQALTANDVAFTFNMLKQYPAADSNGLWSYLSSVSASDASTVTVTFKKSYPPLLWYVGGQTFIVPQHIWSSVGDPTKYPNDPPVGTGPYKMAKFTPQLIDYVKNTSYWQADKVKIDEVKYPTVKDNQTLQLQLMSGQIDWGGFFAPDLDTTFVAKDSAHNHYWMAPVALTMIYPNLTKYPFNQLVVRQAISDALDRQQMSKNAESGYESVASPTGLILPGYQSYLDPAYASTAFSQDVAKANQLLDGAGYTKGSDGVRVDPHGQKMSYTIDVVAGWTDWDTICQIISQNLQAIGIDVKVNQLSFDDYASIRSSGKYDMFMGGSFPGPTPYYLFNDLLNSANLAPNGFNWARWNDPQTDQYLNQYATSTDQAAQVQAVKGIEKVMVEQQPTILLLNAADWYEYSTKNFSGFPDKNNAYALPSPYEAPDNEMIVLNLQSA